MKTKAIYTTGQAAEVCNLSQQTIIRCFDSGRLQGFRVPGSKFRRIPHDSLMQFMRDNNIPLGNIDGRKVRVLVVANDPQSTPQLLEALKNDPKFETQTACTCYDAGIATGQFHPDVIVVDPLPPEINPVMICEAIRGNPELLDVKILVISKKPLSGGLGISPQIQADVFVKKPFDLQEMIGEILQLNQI